MNPTYKCRRFRQELLFRIMGIIFVFVLGIGIMSSYFYFSMRIIPSDGSILWKIFNYGISGFEVLNIILIDICLKINYRYRNLRLTRIIEQPLIFYLICMPFLILAMNISMFLMVIMFFHENLIINGLTINLLVSSISFFVLIILIINTSGFTDTGEEWYMNFINVTTISSAILFIFFQFHYSILYLLTVNFRSLLKPFFNSSMQLSPVSAKMPTLLGGIVIILFVVLIPYFYISLKNNLLHILNYRKESVPSTNPSIWHNKHFLLILGSILTMATTILKVVTEFYSEYFKLWITIVEIVLEFFKILLILVIIPEWQVRKDPNRKIFQNITNVYLFFGLFGVSVKFTSILAQHGMFIFYTSSNMEGYFFIFKDFVKLLELFCQTCFLSLSTDKAPRNRKRLFWWFLFFNCTMLMVDNLGDGIREFEETMPVHKSPSSAFHFLLKGLSAIAKPPVILYHLTAVVIMFDLIMNLLENDI